MKPAPPSPRIPHRNIAVHIPVARLQALVRGVWWGMSALLAGLLSYLVYSSLDWKPTAVTSRLVEYCIAVAALPALATLFYSAFKALRWVALCLWPTGVGVHADERSLVFKLGPFGTRAYDVTRLDVRYPFELSSDVEDGGYEAFLPEEEQVARFLPQLLHPMSQEPLNRVMLRFVLGDEAAVAAEMRPIIERWQSSKSQDESTPRSA